MRTPVVAMTVTATSAARDALVAAEQDLRSAGRIEADIVWSVDEDTTEPVVEVTLGEAPPRT